MKILRSDVIDCIKGGTNLMNVMDDVVMSTYNITEDEMNFIYRYSNNKEHEVFMDIIDGFGNVSTFSQKRLALETRNKYLGLYNETH